MRVPQATEKTQLNVWICNIRMEDGKYDAWSKRAVSDILYTVHFFANLAQLTQAADALGVD